MFDSEANMTGPVKRWMESVGLIVKSELISPWGICDLVGLSFNKRSVARRLELGQRRPVTSMTRAALLLQIPDIGTNESVTLSQIIDACSPALSEEVVVNEAQVLMEDKFVIRQGDRLQKVNGWMPMQKRLIAIELKLKRVEEALLQAQNNLGFVTESYVGLPADLAIRIAGSARCHDFHERGVGLFAVTPASCHLLIRSRRESTSNPVFQFCCVEKFWRTTAKGNLA